jgi:hypothetical protein
MCRLLFMDEQQRSSPPQIDATFTELHRRMKMNATKFLAAAAVFVAAGSAFAADTPVANAAVTAAASTATTSITAVALNVPTVTISSVRARADVKAEAVEAVRSYKSTLAKQLELTAN